MINIGVIGYGYWGPNLVRNFAELDGATMAAVADLDPKKLEIVKRRYPAAIVTRRFEDLLEDPSIHAIAVATPVNTHFDLGIAYREMGLFDDALSEFTVCLGSPARKLECLHMMALCSMELGRNRDAINHLEQALASGKTPTDQTTALRFDLGRVQRRAGDLSAASHAFSAVQQADPRFPGLAEELAALDAAGSGGGDTVELELDTERQDYESFDDILGDDASADANGDTGGGAPETFESFDDVITAADAEDPLPEPEPAVEPEAVIEPEPIADPGASRSGRRKKKISFV